MANFIDEGARAFDYGEWVFFPDFEGEGIMCERYHPWTGWTVQVFPPIDGVYNAFAFVWDRTNGVSQEREVASGTDLLEVCREADEWLLVENEYVAKQEEQIAKWEAEDEAKALLREQDGVGRWEEENA